MNIPSKVLIEAIEFANTDPQFYTNLVARDKTDKLIAKSILAEVTNISKEKQLLRIRIYVDYIPQHQDFTRGQDLVADLLWSPKTGYEIENIFYYPS